MKNIIADILFPRICPVCGEIVDEKGNLVCDKCKKQIVYIREPKCQKCGKSIDGDGRIHCKDCSENEHYYKRGVCVFEYAGPLRESIYQFKFKNAREFGEFYGREAARIYGREFVRWNIDGIIPVPMYKQKEVKRGYNQAEVFARAVGKYTGIPVSSKSLIRVRNTTPQKELVGLKRRKNLDKAFMVNVEEVKKYKRILLVDDIYTTGSTMDACTKLLKKAGVEEVYFLCISAGNI